MKILVTGARGFIGSCFVKATLGTRPDVQVVALVRDSNQNNRARLDGNTPGFERLRIHHGDLTQDISGICEDVDVVVNFAAKTFVDRSIKDPKPFVESNVLGTYALLEQARKDKVKRYIQISTDEVYGAILSGSYKEDARINPTNPYAATKAGADALVMAYTHTFGLWTAITRTENNYGPYQGPEKVFPTFVKKALKGEQLPVYGDGKHRRMWLHVSDHVAAVWHLIEADVPSGEVWHVAGEQELENLELAHWILRAVDNYNDPRATQSFERRIKFVPDYNIRPGHDRRYALNCEKLRATGWAPKVALELGIAATVDWYCKNQWWME